MGVVFSGEEGIHFFRWLLNQRQIYVALIATAPGLTWESLGLAMLTNFSQSSNIALLHTQGQVILSKVLKGDQCVTIGGS